MTPIVQFYCPNLRVIKWPHQHIHEWPCIEDNSVKGRGYGWSLRQAWEQVADRGPIITLEQDVAFDPIVWSDFALDMAAYPEDVVAVPYILWPTHTGREKPIWSNLVKCPTHQLKTVPADEPPPNRPATCGLGLTYLPARLLRAVVDKLPLWYYPHLDFRLSVEAEKEGIPIHGTRVPAMHLHY